MKQTLLEMTQDILSGLSSDEVNSISDTSESLQVATIIKNKWNDIVARSHLQEHKDLFQLTASGDDASPILMIIPDNIGKIEWVKYFNSRLTEEVPYGYQYVTVLPVQQFLDYVNGYNPQESTTETFVFTDNYNNVSNTFNFYYKTDKQPAYCTVIADKYVVFDSFDSTVDTTLQNSKTMVYGEIVSQFKMEDGFIPELDDNQFSLLLNEAKALAFYELRQMVHIKAEQEIKRQWSSTSKNQNMSGKPTAFDALPNFGRNKRAKFSK